MPAFHVFRRFAPSDTFGVGLGRTFGAEEFPLLGQGQRSRNAEIWRPTAALDVENRMRSRLGRQLDGFCNRPRPANPRAAKRNAAATDEYVLAASTSNLSAGGNFQK